ncbi:MAG: RpiB/LacA/LacB family sugar-phosphate isomerase [Bacteroidales bacterium]
MKIGIIADHAGYEMKQTLYNAIIAMGHSVCDYGTSSNDSIDYPDFAHILANKVSTHEVNYGIALCGTGNGMAITLNKHPKIRAGLCWNNEIATLIRQHNDANICVIPARFCNYEAALEMIKTFLTTDFEGGRHAVRVAKITI